MVYKLARTLVVVILTAFAFPSFAIQINSMLVVADDQDQGTFTITNTQDGRIFLNALMSEIHVEDGELTRKHYNRNNVQDWKIDLRPARTIINKGFEKDFHVKLKCAPNCNREYDEVYKLSFIPTPYTGELEENHSVQMAIGFAPVFIAPGKEFPLDYQLNYSKNQVTIRNNGNSFIKVKVTSCSENSGTLVKADCTRSAYVLAGRLLTLSLPEGMRSEVLNVTLATYKDTYSEQVDLEKRG